MNQFRSADSLVREFLPIGSRGQPHSQESAIDGGVLQTLRALVMAAG
jgi:hypothetical protein